MPTNSYNLDDDALYTVWVDGLTDRDAIYGELASGGEGSNKIGVTPNFGEYGFVSKLTRDELHGLLDDERVIGIDYDYDLTISDVASEAAVPCLQGYDCTSCLTGGCVMTDDGRCWTNCCGPSTAWRASARQSRPRCTRSRIE